MLKGSDLHSRMFNNETFKSSVASSSSSSHFTVENVVHIPNKPRLSIDASARASNTIRLSPGFLETVASCSKDDDVSRRIHEATRRYSQFGAEFFERFREELGGGRPGTYERLKSKSSHRRRITKMDSHDDSGRATTSSEASSICDDDSTAFSPYRSRLSAFPSSQSLFDQNDFPSMSARLEQIKNDIFISSESEYTIKSDRGNCRISIVLSSIRLPNTNNFFGSSNARSQHEEYSSIPIPARCPVSSERGTRGLYTFCERSEHGESYQSASQTSKNGRCIINSFLFKFLMTYVTVVFQTPHI
uniref:Membrane-associated kinase regulator n=1 Tax=Heterorhabditis bacteriophora TaxID=37862 RepID=A0A1I7XBB3_HETBA